MPLGEKFCDPSASSLFLLFIQVAVSKSHCSIEMFKTAPKGHGFYQLLLKKSAGMLSLNFYSFILYFFF